jgi:predicted unusual protein kinase regulating ubiquinone biosynthesis (AarF/ABC1/UbiB family)
MVFTMVQRLAGYADMARHAVTLRRSDEQHVRRQVRRHLAQRMGRLRGLPQKLGQMLSFSSDEESAADFTELQEAAEPLPQEAVQPVLEAAWRRPLFDVLRDIDPRAKAASLGQVHHAVTRNGRQVAVKVQYPGIRRSIDADLGMLGWLSLPVGNLRRGFDLSAYRRVILDDIDRELDYRLEAATQREFRHWAEEDPFLAVPQVVEDLSTENILVSEWEEGEMFDAAAGWDVRRRRKLARGMLRWFLAGLFERGLMHADLHPGNLRFRSLGDYVQMLLYDFGCVYRPSREQRLTLLRLIRATVRRDESPWPLLLKLGFRREWLAPLSAKLPALCRLLFEPFAAEYPYDAADWRLGQRVADVLGDDRWNFRVAGPPEMILLLRAFHGLQYYLSRLDAPLFWSREIAPYFDRYAAEMDALRLDVEGAAAYDFSTLAKHLKIRVTERGRVKVELTSYASGIDDLDHLLDEDLRRRIDAQGIDLPRIVRDVRCRGYAPGPVFTLAEGEKRVEVWLE